MITQDRILSTGLLQHSRCIVHIPGVHIIEVGIAWKHISLGPRERLTRCSYFGNADLVLKERIYLRRSYSEVCRSSSTYQVR